jgi:hypothetical protein
MRLAAVSLTLAAAGFVAFGLALLVAPGLLALVDLEPVTPTARSDARAIFGGMELGVGVLLALCARRPEWHRVGLTAQGVALGGAVTGRLVSLAVDGAPRPVTFALAALELVGAALAAVALRKLGATAAGRGG